MIRKAGSTNRGLSPTVPCYFSAPPLLTMTDTINKSNANVFALFISFRSLDPKQLEERLSPTRMYERKHRHEHRGSYNPPNRRPSIWMYKRAIPPEPNHKKYSAAHGKTFDSAGNPVLKSPRFKRINRPSLAIRDLAIGPLQDLLCGSCDGLFLLIVHV